jgi:signal transduction histidine kinase
VSHYAEEKRVKIETPKTIAKEFCLVYIDSHRFQQVIVNILSNSLKYSNTDAKINLDLQLIESKQVQNDDIYFEKSERD